MDPYRSAGVPSERNIGSLDGDYSVHAGQSTSSSVNNHTAFTTSTDWATNNAFPGHPFDEISPLGGFTHQGDYIPHPQAHLGVSEGYPSFENQRPSHARPIEQGNQYPESYLDNEFSSGGAGMYSIASSSSSSQLGPKTLAPAPSHPSAVTFPSSPPPVQPFCGSPVTPQYTPHAQTSSPLMALVNNGHSRSDPDPIKLSEEQTEDIKALLLQCSWYTKPDEEPPVKPGDPFLMQGLILSTDKSRFSAFVTSNSHGGKRYCRIKHILQKKELVECDFSAVHQKDTIAHICEYLNYRPYKCRGTVWHPECDSTYPTHERRTDHYAKKKKGPDPFKLCAECGASITARNFPRHQETCQNTN